MVKGGIRGGLVIGVDYAGTGGWALYLSQQQRITKGKIPFQGGPKDNGRSLPSTKLPVKKKHFHP